MNAAQRKEAERTEAIADLTNDLAACSHYVRHYDGKRLPTVYVNITSVSRSGMSRRMRVYVYMPSTNSSSHPDGYLANITRTVGKVYRAHVNDNGVRVDGCGMDMRFHLCDYIAHACGIGDGNDIDIRTI